MLFARDTEIGLAAAAGLVNSELPDIESLDRFYDEWGWSGPRARTQAELRAVHELRPRLREIWFASEERVVEIVNALFLETKALPQLIKHDEWDYHFHATPQNAPLADRMAVEAAMAVADLVRSKELSRLRECADPECDNVLVDLSKNRSRRFCEGNCGNRAAVAAYRARKAGKG